MEEGHLPFLDIDVYRKTDGSLVLKVYRKPTIPISTYTRIRITILRTNSQSSLLWYTGTKLSVTKIPSLKNWKFSPPFSRTMDTAINRYNVPRNRQHGPPRPMINLPRLHTDHTLKQHMAASAECWPNTSEVSPYHREKYPATFHQSRMLRD